MVKTELQNDVEKESKEIKKVETTPKHVQINVVEKIYISFPLRHEKAEQRKPTCAERRANRECV